MRASNRDKGSRYAGSLPGGYYKSYKTDRTLPGNATLKLPTGAKPYTSFIHLSQIISFYRNVRKACRSVRFQEFWSRIFATKFGTRFAIFSFGTRLMNISLIDRNRHFCPAFLVPTIASTYLLSVTPEQFI